MRGLGLGIQLATRERAAAAFDPLSLFAGGEQGAWYDPSDLQSMFQDSASTVPAAVGAPVGRILDKSGRGNHAAQAVAASRPVLGQDQGGRLFLEFDGVDDFLSAGDAMDLGPSGYWATAGAEFNSSADGTVFAKSVSAAASGRYAMLRIAASGGLISLYEGSGTSLAGAADSSTATRVLTSRLDRAAGTLAMLVNRVQLGATTSFPPDAGTIHDTSYRFLIGAYNDGSDNGIVIPLAGRIYALMLRLGAPDDGLIAKSEVYVAGKSGVLF
jgi:hypothetical protein